MLILKRMVEPYEVRRCDISGEYIIQGDFFYEDDIDGTTVKASVYKKLQKEARDAAFDYTLLNQAKSEKEYAQALKKAEKEFLMSTILDRPVYDNGIGKEKGLD